LQTDSGIGAIKQRSSGKTHQVLPASGNNLSQKSAAEAKKG
jgi:hypothetical protein